MISRHLIGALLFLSTSAASLEPLLSARASVRIARYPKLSPVIVSPPAHDGTISASVSLLGADARIAWATYRDDTNATGWAYLELHTNATFDDDVQAFAAGVLEASLTFETILLSVINTGGAMPWAPKVAAWLDANDDFIRESIATHEGDAFWHHVSLTYAQIDGLWAGYDKAVGGEHALTALPFWVIYGLSLGGDLEDLVAAVGGSSTTVSGDAGHCSAFVKLLADGSDLFFGQVTWSSFESMLRIYKLYDLAYSYTGQRGTAVVATVSFSGYPGSVFSGDDYYTTSHGLAVLETTIGNDNATLYDLYVRPASVLEFVRNTVANRLAAGGSEWARIFSAFNSGTYNNEFLIVDYKLFTPYLPLRPGTLTILEQIPGLIQAVDATPQLESAGYAASYNTVRSPLFPDIWTLGGFAAEAAKGGPWFGFNTTARALIFARNETHVTDAASFGALLRYNDYLHDPISKQGCSGAPPSSAENAISARDDLNPPDGVYPINALGHRDHAGIDAKYTSANAYASWQKGTTTSWASTIVSGPTYGDVPPFVWSTSPFATTPHLGMADEQRFPWVRITWPLNVTALE